MSTQAHLRKGKSQTVSTRATFESVRQKGGTGPYLNVYERVSLTAFIIFLCDPCVSPSPLHLFKSREVFNTEITERRRDRRTDLKCEYPLFFATCAKPAFPNSMHEGSIS